MTLQQLKQRTEKDEDRYLTAVVAVPFDDLLDHGVEWLNDTASAMITGDDCALEDISYTLAGALADEVLIRVNGSILSWLQSKEAEKTA